MQNNAQILFDNKTIGLNHNFSVVKPFSKKEKVWEKYNELLVTYNRLYKGLDFEILEIQKVTSQLFYICLANGISKRKLSKIVGCVKLTDRQLRYKYYIEKLDSINSKSTLNQLIYKLKKDQNELFEVLKCRIRKPLKFPQLSSDKIISKEKYNKKLISRYRKLVQFFELLNNGDCIDEYIDIRKRFNKLIEKIEAINLFKNINIDDYEFVMQNYRLVNEICLNYSLIQKMERFSLKNKLDFEFEIEDIENYLFELMATFDNNIDLLNYSLQRIVKS